MSVLFMNCYLKIHSRFDNIVVGVCDEDCLGKILEKDKFRFNVSEVFFKDQLVSQEEAVKVLKKASNFNVVGKNIIDALIEKEIIHKDGIIAVDEVPIAIKFLF